MKACWCGLVVSVLPKSKRFLGLHPHPVTKTPRMIMEQGADDDEAIMVVKPFEALGYSVPTKW